MLAFPGHFGVGLIFSRLADLNPLLVIIGSLLPDFDALPYFFGFDYRKNHRTFLHSMFIPLIIAFISIPVAIGIMLHLLVDLTTYPGIKLFYPLSDKEFFIYKSSNKKYDNPINFIKDIVKNKRYLAFETSIFLLGVLLIF